MNGTTGGVGEEPLVPFGRLKVMDIEITTDWADIASLILVRYQ